MRNPIGDLDDGIMYLANKAVRGYNSVFGGTKADLANKMLSTSLILQSIGCINSSALEFTILAAPIRPVVGYMNRYIEKNEVRALESGKMDIDAENFKAQYSFMGPIFLGTGIGLRFVSSKPEEGNLGISRFLSDSLLCLGVALMGASFYVMRADNLPPKKSIFSKAKDKLVEIVRNIELNPPILIPQPVPIPVQVSGGYS